jgi:hypothetical protein
VRPKIAIISDVGRNWAWARKAEQLRQHLGDQFQIEVAHLYDAKPDPMPSQGIRPVQHLRGVPGAPAAGGPALRDRHDGARLAHVGAAARRRHRAQVGRRRARLPRQQPLLEAEMRACSSGRSATCRTASTRPSSAARAVEPAAPDCGLGRQAQPAQGLRHRDRGLPTSPASSCAPSSARTETRSRPSRCASSTRTCTCSRRQRHGRHAQPRPRGGGVRRGDRLEPDRQHARVHPRRHQRATWWSATSRAWRPRCASSTWPPPSAWARPRAQPSRRAGPGATWRRRTAGCGWRRSARAARRQLDPLRRHRHARCTTAEICSSGRCARCSGGSTRSRSRIIVNEDARADRPVVEGRTEAIIQEIAPMRRWCPIGSSSRAPAPAWRSRWCGSTRPPHRVRPLHPGGFRFRARRPGGALPRHHAAARAQSRPLQQAQHVADQGRHHPDSKKWWTKKEWFAFDGQTLCVSDHIYFQACINRRALLLEGLKEIMLGNPEGNVRIEAAVNRLVQHQARRRLRLVDG